MRLNMKNESLGYDWNNLVYSYERNLEEHEADRRVEQMQRQVAEARTARLSLTAAGNVGHGRRIEADERLFEDDRKGRSGRPEQWFCSTQPGGYRILQH